MATGQTEGGGVVSVPDVRGIGDAEWASVSGMRPTNPLVGGPRAGGLGPFDVDHGGPRIVTTPEAQQGPAAGGALLATPDGAGAGVAVLDDWRDLFNFRGSPMPWLLLLTLLMIGFMQFRLDARARAGRASASASAALG